MEYIQCSKSCACSYKLQSLQQYIHNLIITEHLFQMTVQLEHIDLCTLRKQTMVILLQKSIE